MKPRPVPFALLLAVCGGAAAATGPAARLGTLLFSPEERLAIANARGGGKPAELRSTLAVNGFVLRPGGRSTVWINEQPIAEGQVNAATAFPRIDGSGVVIGGKRTRVGETFDPATGERTDLIPQGAVAARRPR